MNMKNREKPARETLSRLQCVCALMGLIVTAAAIPCPTHIEGSAHSAATVDSPPLGSTGIPE